MNHDEPPLKNIGKEFLTPGFVERARDRRRKSRNPWDLVFLPIGFAAIGGYWYAFTKFFLWFHLLVYPGDVTHLHGLISSPMTMAQALMFLVPAFSSIPLGFMTSNILMWLVPPARRSSEKNATGVKWASFRQSQLALSKVTTVLAPVGLVSWIIGALILGR